MGFAGFSLGLGGGAGLSVMVGPLGATAAGAAGYAVGVGFGGGFCGLDLVLCLFSGFRGLWFGSIFIGWGWRCGFVFHVEPRFAFDVMVPCRMV